jgi:hypothetical protein
MGLVITRFGGYGFRQEARKPLQLRGRVDSLVVLLLLIGHQLPPVLAPSPGSIIHC